MLDIKKARILKMAITSLPDPKTYPANIIRVRVGSTNVPFEKIQNEWFLKTN